MKRGWRFRVVTPALAAAVAMPGGAWAVSATLDADAWTTSSSPSANKGKSTTLEVVNTGTATKTAYIKFDLSALPTCSSGAVSKATLRLFVKKVTAAGTFDLKRVGADWAEATISDSGAPTVGPDVQLDVGVTADDKNQFVAVDVTTTVQAWCDTPASNYGLVLLADTPLNVKFDSKESTSTSHAPQLEVVVSAPVTSANVVDGSLTRADINLASITDLTGSNISDGTLGNVDIDFSTASGTYTTAVGDGALAFNVGSFNTAVGTNALRSNTTAVENVAVGDRALESSNGSRNTAVGKNALSSNTDGADNTAVGRWVLYNNTGGDRNTALGALALGENTMASDCTAVGYRALGENNGASTINTAVGSEALATNTSGNYNTALGYEALTANDDGTRNTAVGYGALDSNVSGSYNTALGQGALGGSTGDSNTALGRSALSGLTSGGANIAIGAGAGSALTSGGSNIYIGTAGGASSESNVTRIGPLSIETYIGGIYSPTVSTRAVYVNSSGQLGTLSSSRRFKTDIRSLRGVSGKLLRLRPVSFRYKQDVEAGGGLQYGLIAEEVAKVFPELVEFDSAGQPYTVRYHLLSALLLNELQQQDREQEALRLQVKQQQQDVAELRAYNAGLQERLERIEHTVEAAARPVSPVGARRAAAAQPDADL